MVFTVILRLTVILPYSAHTVLFYCAGLKSLKFYLKTPADIVQLFCFDRVFMMVISDSASR